MLLVVKLVLVLGFPTSTTRKFSVVFIEVLLCHLRVGILYPWVIHKTKDHMLNKILGGRIMVVILVILDLVLVLGPPTYPPKKEILLATGEVGDIRNRIMIAQPPPWFYLAVGII